MALVEYQGDAVQMSSVLRHLKKYRPEWTTDYQAEEGRHQVARGIINGQSFSYGESYPHNYDAEVQILLYDVWANWQDRPNTRVASCLHERFGLGWDPECARYQVNVPDLAMQRAKLQSTIFLHGHLHRSGQGVVAIHYQGVSSQPKKNLSDQQALTICGAVHSMGAEPLLLDYINKSPIRSVGRATNPEWGNSAVMQCAVIRQCRAFIGIDSGPSKCASATDTPALVIWTGHHPAQFHDPASNTTHLVPVRYHGLEPVCNDPGVTAWFEAHHNIMQYEGDPVYKVKEWLQEVLK